MKRQACARRTECVKTRSSVLFTNLDKEACPHYGGTADCSELRYREVAQLVLNSLELFLRWNFR